MPVVLPASVTLVARFEDMCVAPEAGPVRVAVRAHAAGWRPVTPPRGLTTAAESPDEALMVAAGETTSAAEAVETCSVMTSAHLGDLAQTVGDTFHLTAAVAFPGSATFLAYRDVQGWHAAPADRATFARVRAAGEVYSLVVSDGPNGSGIVAINPRPTPR